MIKVEYSGRLGNRMFQYALGRYLAEQLQYELVANPLPFPATSDKIRGNAFTEPQEIFREQFLDISAILQNRADRAIILKGYFQKSYYYLPFIEQIRHWFKTDIERPSKHIEISDDDLLVYIRLGDYFKLNLSLAYQFYETAIEMASPNRIFIVTDGPDNPFLNRFQKYNPTFLVDKDNPVAEIVAARSFKKIAISCSTFSWWAVMLSDASEIYFPIGRSGWWSGCNSDPVDQNSMDLRIDDPRFIYFYNCPTIKHENASFKFSPIESVKPNLTGVHKQSKAFWFL